LNPCFFYERKSDKLHFSTSIDSLCTF
jgi:hypothetical protein